MENSAKPLKFNGTAGGYFVAGVVSYFMTLLIIVGWPIAFNYVSNWIIENTEVNGKKMKYSAGYGETLVFLIVNLLLVMITLGIYAFWFVPKSYRFVVDHSSYDAEVPAPAPVAEAPTPPVAPAPVV